MSRSQMTENKGKEGQTSDKAHYVHTCIGGYVDWLTDAHALYAEYLKLSMELGSPSLTHSNVSRSPISPSDASLASADAILRDDEK